MTDIKLFIVEGESKDLRFINRMIDVFFDEQHNSRIIKVPAKQNIFMLYDILKKDDFETDVVEVIRDNVEGAKQILEGCSRRDIAEVYLFFDYDIQQLGEDIDNESVTMDKLFEVFDDETENGKLYISYPMIEALYDYKNGYCDSFSKCYIDVDDFINYKTMSGKNNPNASSHLNYEDWKEILSIFSFRIKCLYDDNNMDYMTFKESIIPSIVYNKQSFILTSTKTIFVLSALPEFLFEYFKIDFWKKYSRKKKYVADYCVKK